MNDEARASSILSAADQFISAVERHALALSQDPDNAPAVVAAADDLASAMQTYRDIVSGETDWGVPFAVAEDDELTQGEARKGGDVVVVEVEYILRVHDINGAFGVLNSRKRLTGQQVCSDFLENPVDVVHSLFRIDGWDPRSYGNSVEVISQEWTCLPQDREP